MRLSDAELANCKWKALKSALSLLCVSLWIKSLKFQSADNFFRIDALKIFVWPTKSLSMDSLQTFTFSEIIKIAINQTCCLTLSYANFSWESDHTIWLIMDLFLENFSYHFWNTLQNALWLILFVLLNPPYPSICFDEVKR